MNKQLHIVCHTIPFPAKNGGTIEILQTIKELHSAGIHITLHCFIYNNVEQAALNEYCTNVFYYHRKIGWRGLSLQTPYIVHSRRNIKLLERLSKDNFPILLEGIHCTAFVENLKKSNRQIFLRLPNVETIYYRHLSKHETTIFRKLYFRIESLLLNKYEQALPKDIPILALSTFDADYYRAKLGMKNVQVIPAFIPFEKLNSKPGLGDYCLYHADLSVIENEVAANWLMDTVFSKLSIPLIIAGRNPPRKLKSKISRYHHVKLVPNPSDDEMHQLVSNAQINLLPSFNNTGIKLKLLNALYNGRHCLVNDATILGSGLNSVCHIASDTPSFLQSVQSLMGKSISIEELEKRNQLLQMLYNNKKNVEQLIKSIW